MKADQNNKYDITKTWSLVQVWFKFVLTSLRLKSESLQTDKLGTYRHTWQEKKIQAYFAAPKQTEKRVESLEYLAILPSIQPIYMQARSVCLCVTGARRRASLNAITGVHTLWPELPLFSLSNQIDIIIMKKGVTFWVEFEEPKSDSKGQKILKAFFLTIFNSSKTPTNFSPSL